MSASRKAVRYKHTSKVSPEKTAGQIQALLIRLGVTKIAMDTEDGAISGMAFLCKHEGTEVAYRMPIRWKPVYDVMLEEFECKKFRQPLAGQQLKTAMDKVMAQAKRTAWRIAYEWLRVQVAFVEDGGRDLLEVFMADVIMPGSDRTLGEQVKERGVANLLPPPKEV